jgi:hypothetical protein
MKAFWQSMWYWRIAALRCFVYMLIVGGGTFLSMTETWSAETWSSTPMFLKVRLFIGVGLSSFGVLLAFLDTTMNALREGKEPSALPGKTIPILFIAAGMILVGCTKHGYRHTLCYGAACYSIDRPHYHKGTNTFTKP